MWALRGKPRAARDAVLARWKLRSSCVEETASRKQRAYNALPERRSRTTGPRAVPRHPSQQRPKDGSDQSTAGPHQTQPLAAAGQDDAVPATPVARRAETSQAARAAAGSRSAEGRAGPAGATRRAKNALSVGEDLKILSQNVAGMPQNLSWEMCMQMGYDVVMLQETHGDEQKKDEWPAGRLFTGAQPPRNDPAAGVAISLSEELSRCVAPGGVILGQRFPSRVLCIRIRTRGSHDILLVNA